MTVNSCYTICYCAVNSAIIFVFETSLQVACGKLLLDHPLDSSFPGYASLCSSPPPGRREEQLLQSPAYASSNVAQLYLIYNERTFFTHTQPGIHPANHPHPPTPFSAELQLNHLVPKSIIMLRVTLCKVQNSPLLLDELQGVSVSLMVKIIVNHSACQLHHPPLQFCTVHKFAEDRFLSHHPSSQQKY